MEKKTSHKAAIKQSWGLIINKQKEMICWKGESLLWAHWVVCRQFLLD